jgi:hypothetical protein
MLIAYCFIKILHFPHWCKTDLPKAGIVSCMLLSLELLSSSSVVYSFFPPVFLSSVIFINANVQSVYIVQVTINVSSHAHWNFNRVKGFSFIYLLIYWDRVSCVARLSWNLSSYSHILLCAGIADVLPYAGLWIFPFLLLFAGHYLGNV